MKKKTSLKPSVLTPADLTALVNTMKVVFPTREDVETIVEEKLDAKIKNIPTKNDFFTRMDMLTKEIKDAREELAAHTISHDRLTEKEEELDVRVATLEKKVGTHAMNN